MLPLFRYYFFFFSLCFGMQYMLIVHPLPTAIQHWVDQDTVSLRGPTVNRQDTHNLGNLPQHDAYALEHVAHITNTKRNKPQAANNINVGIPGKEVGLADRLHRLGITVNAQELQEIQENYLAFMSNNNPVLRQQLPHPLPPRLARSQQAGNGKFGPYLDLRGISLQGYNLSMEDIDNPTGRINLQGANLRGATLSGANFTGANFQGANLADTQLSGTIFDGAQLQGANLSELPNPVGQQWPQSNRPTGKNLASFRGANLTGANLTDGNFYFADLTQAILVNTILDGTDFSRANLTGTNLIHTNARYEGQERGTSYNDRLYDSRYLLYRDLQSNKLWRARIDRFTTLCMTQLDMTHQSTVSQTIGCLTYRESHTP